MNIAYATDDGYAKLAGVSLLSLLSTNTHTNEINIYMLDDGISDLNKQKLTSTAQYFNRNIFFVDVKEKIKLISEKISKKWKSGFTTYARLFIPELLPDCNGKFLYLDCDTLINGNIEDMFNLDMSGTDGMEHSMAMSFDASHFYYKNSVGIKHHFCAGVMLMDLDLWRERKITEKIVSRIVPGEHYTFADQTLINLTMQDDIAFLPFKYDFINIFFFYTARDMAFINRLPEYIEHEKDYEKAKKNPVIYHLSGRGYVAPWFKNSKHPVKRLYDEYYYKSEWRDIEQNTKEIDFYGKMTAILHKWVPHWFFVVVSKVVTEYVMRRAFKSR